MKRLLLTIDRRRCPFGCLYCFSRFTQYEGVPSLADAESRPELLAGVDLLYPACDVDLFARTDAVGILERAAALGRSISVSTKAALSETIVRQIARIEAGMRRTGRTLKVAVSFSTRNRIPILEPGTATYEARLRGLELLATAGIPRSITIKPVLSCCSAEEYGRILSDCAPFVSSATIGDEYLDTADLRANPSSMALRRVEWLPGPPVWPVREDPQKIRHIRTIAQALSIRLFDSDWQLVRELASGELASSPAA